MFGSQVNCKFPVRAAAKPPSHFDRPTQPARVPSKIGHQILGMGSVVFAPQCPSPSEWWPQPISASLTNSHLSFASSLTELDPESMWKTRRTDPRPRWTGFATAGRGAHDGILHSWCCSTPNLKVPCAILDNTCHGWPAPHHSWPVWWPPVFRWLCSRPWHPNCKLQAD